MTNSIPRRSILCACILVLSISTVAGDLTSEPIDAATDEPTSDPDYYYINNGDDIKYLATDTDDTAVTSATPTNYDTYSPTFYATPDPDDNAVTATDSPTVSTTNKSTSRATAAATLKATAAATVKTTAAATVKTTEAEEAVTPIVSESPNDEEAVGTQIDSKAVGEKTEGYEMSASNLESSASSHELKIFPVLLVVVGLGIF
eukprot:CAMPEP_0194326424 /NCGR_PEP_ID=MMETSP0171-20130528/36460_1 /TAXON_ID=218684 /ORGANISM="Corethron pennatum, Strain L29A3" /LENGTH=202 /DNA_ID=CAMNT_0039085995 /DNA_START=46 /DNA_END=654 /DNA_ORIENTATION=-